MLSSPIALTMVTMFASSVRCVGVPRGVTSPCPLVQSLRDNGRHEDLLKSIDADGSRVLVLRDLNELDLSRCCVLPSVTSDFVRDFGRCTDGLGPGLIDGIFETELFCVLYPFTPEVDEFLFLNVFMLYGTVSKSSSTSPRGVAGLPCWGIADENSCIDRLFLEAFLLFFSIDICETVCERDATLFPFASPTMRAFLPAFMSSYTSIGVWHTTRAPFST